MLKSNFENNKIDFNDFRITSKQALNFSKYQTRSTLESITYINIKLVPHSRKMAFQALKSSSKRNNHVVNVETFLVF